MYWPHSTGPESYEHEAEEKEIYALLEEREALKAKQAPTVMASDKPRLQVATCPRRYPALTALLCTKLGQERVHLPESLDV